MKFTIALTFFAAASALELKEDDGLLVALNTNVSDVGEFLDCIYEEEDVMLDDMPNAEISAFKSQVEAAIEKGQMTVGRVMKEIFGMTMETHADVLRDIYHDIMECAGATDDDSEDDDGDEGDEDDDDDET